MLKQLNQAEFRNYSGQDNYVRIDEFLIEYHQPNNAHGNWLEPMWEYMHFHPYLDHASLGKIGIWEAAGEIVAVSALKIAARRGVLPFSPWLTAAAVVFWARRWPMLVQISSFTRRSASRKFTTASAG